MDHSLLSGIHTPADLRRLPRTELKRLADELRAFVLDSVSKTGGHLGSNLGTVELTVALHYVYNTPEDRLVWDVGHQTYPHKVLTGRRERMGTLRQLGGISGDSGELNASLAQVHAELAAQGRLDDYAIFRRRVIDGEPLPPDPEMQYRTLAAPGLDEDDVFAALMGLPGDVLWGDGHPPYPFPRQELVQEWSEESDRERRRREILERWKPVDEGDA